MEEATWKQEGAKVCSLNQETWLYRMMMTLNLISKKVKVCQLLRKSSFYQRNLRTGWRIATAWSSISVIESFN